MRRVVAVVAGSVLSVLASLVPPTHAAVLRSGCGSNITDTGTVYSGPVFGYALFDEQGTHTLRCYITVDGSERASTPTGSGTGAVSAAGQVSFNAPPWSTKDLCAEIDGSTVSCAPLVTRSTGGGMPPACRDGVDNDLDGEVDTADSGCNGDPNGTSEGTLSARKFPTMCSDGIDNDLDGRTDTDDPDCGSPSTFSEGLPGVPSLGSSCSTVAGVEVCLSYTGVEVYSVYDVYAPGTTGLQVKGYLQDYEFKIQQTGTTLTLPCVRFDGAPDPCAAATGTPSPGSTPMTLVDQSVAQPTGGLTTPLATVTICKAVLVLTVDGKGLTHQDAYSRC